MNTPPETLLPIASPGQGNYDPSVETRRTRIGVLTHDTTRRSA